MAWHTIQATNDLLVELCPTGEADNQLHVRIRSRATDEAMPIYLAEVRYVVSALVDAATQLAEAEVSSSHKDTRF